MRQRGAERDSSYAWRAGGRCNAAAPANRRKGEGWAWCGGEGGTRERGAKVEGRSDEDEAEEEGTVNDINA